MIFNRLGSNNRFIVANQNEGSYLVEKKGEPDREEKPKFEKCLYSHKLVDPYYKNFHSCKGLNRSV
jgi:hypothetical protein